MIFQHPFTMMICGPTCSGKTFWVKNLLESRPITPLPQQIFWFYRRWQPLYSEIALTIPNIKFIQGIPHDIGNDSYFDARYNTLFIIDDLMKDATTSSDICDLYTEGSHHRNLSVICLLQNMYYKGKEMRTMSLNTHYMVLFKNPRDQQQISCLARQMYPSQSHYFMQEYERATARPHGCLVVDLKQNTPEDQRLKYDVFKNDINRSDQKEEHQSTKNTPTEHKDPFKQEILPYTLGPNGLPYVDLLNPLVDMSTPSKHIVPTCHCLTCGQVFATPQDLKYHCDNDLCTDHPSDTDMESDDSSDEDITENYTFQCILEKAKEENEGKWKKIADKYIDDGMDEDEAKNKADKKMVDEDKSVFKTKLTHFMLLVNGIRRNQLIKNILTEYDSYNNMSEKKAMKKAITKYIDHFDDLFEEDSEDEESDTETDSDMETESETEESESEEESDEGAGESINGQKKYNPSVEKWKQFLSNPLKK